MDDINISIDEPNVSISQVSEDIEITDQFSTDYNLPIASADTLGGVKIGANISEQSDGTISVPIASAFQAGVIKVGQNLTIEEDGTLNGQAGGSSYVLPQATAVTLGGVYVDTTMSSSSPNPVQNKVINNQLSGISSSITELSNTQSAQADTISNLSSTVGGYSATITQNTDDITALQTTVGNNTNDISDNAANIITNTNDIDDLQSRMLLAEGNITDITNATSEMAGSIADLSTTIDTTYTYEDIDDTIWSSGNIRIEGQGRIEFAYINLEGSLTLADNTPYTVLTIDESAILPQYESISILNTDAGIVECIIDTSGNIKIINNSGSSITITRIYGCVPMVVAYGLSE